MTAELSLSTEVVRAVAAAEGVNERTLSPVLYDAINPDALDVLFRNTTGQVTFEYQGYTVIITSEGDIEIKPLTGH